MQKVPVPEQVLTPLAAGHRSAHKLTPVAKPSSLPSPQARRSCGDRCADAAVFQ